VFRRRPNSHDLIRSALADVVTLAEQPSGVVQISEHRARSDCETVVLDYLDL